jgi:hypothetical protein
MPGLDDFAVLELVNIDSHDFKWAAFGWKTGKGTSLCALDGRAYNYLVPCLEDFVIGDL